MYDIVYLSNTEVIFKKAAVWVIFGCVCRKIETLCTKASKKNSLICRLDGLTAPLICVQKEQLYINKMCKFESCATFHCCKRSDENFLYKHSTAILSLVPTVDKVSEINSSFWSGECSIRVSQLTFILGYFEMKKTNISQLATRCMVSTFSKVATIGQSLELSTDSSAV